MVRMKWVDAMDKNTLEYRELWLRRAALALIASCEETIHYKDRDYRKIMNSVTWLLVGHVPSPLQKLLGPERWAKFIDQFPKPQPWAKAKKR